MRTGQIQTSWNKMANGRGRKTRGNLINSYFNDLNRLFKKLIAEQKLAMLHNFDYSEHQMVPMGMLCFVGFPLCYLVWKYIFPQPYESGFLSIIGSFLGFLLMIKESWPKRWQVYLPTFWYITIMYCFPFFFGVFLLKNHWNEVSVISMLSAIFLLVLLADWLNLNILFFTGTIIAYLVDWLTNPFYKPSPILIQYLFLYVLVIIAGTIFNFKSIIIREEKITAMSLVMSSIAHELRTPLLGIKSGAIGLMRYLPILFDGYKQARENGLPVTSIRAAHYDVMVNALGRIEHETNNANTMIDILLMNVGKQVINPSAFELCSLKECVTEALRRYPFSSQIEAQKIVFSSKQDAMFIGVKVLMIHVIFNLLKNALHYIAKAKKGNIHIWIVSSKDQCILYFKDTGVGIPTEIQSRIFDRFFSTSQIGTGVGLSFCRLVVESFDGSIACNSEYGAYTEFRIMLPQVRKEVIPTSLTEETAENIHENMTGLT